MEGNMPQGEAGGTSGQGQSSNTGQSQGQPNAGGTAMKADAKGLLSQLETMLDTYMITKAPFALPGELKEFIVKVSPYLVIVFAVLALPVIFLALGISSVAVPFAMMGGYGHGLGYGGWGFGMMVSVAVSAITLVMYLMAVPGLFKRTKGAWRLVFYASVVSLLGSILSFNIIGGIISAVIGWYILFQVKEKYIN